jgi:hypothetical protein
MNSTTKMLAFASAFAAGLLASVSAQAVVCTGTTQALGNGGTATGAFLLTPGNCVTVSDKIFGEFAVSGAISGAGAAQWSFVNSPGNVTVGFLGAVLPGSVGGITYSVEVDEALAPGWAIVGLEKDFTFNASTPGLFASAALTGGVTSPFVVPFSCSRDVNPAAATCPENHSFAPVDEISVSQTITTDANALVTAITDTIIQAESVSEPGVLAMLGTALGLLWLGNRFWARREEYGNA